MRVLTKTPGDGFAQSPTGEPHHVRRRTIIRQHPEIRQLFGHDTRTAWVTLGVVLAQFGLAAWVGAAAEAGTWLGSFWGVVVLTFAVGAILSHWAGQSIHETSHNLALRGAMANRLLALFANLPMVLPIAMTFHRYHLDHHRYLGVTGEDTDLPTAFEVKHIGNSTWRKSLWLAFYFFVYTVRGATFVKRPNRAEWLNLALQVAVNAVIVATLGWTALAYLALSTVIGHSLHPVAAHFIHEHYIFAGNQETYSYYGPLNHVTFNVGYHVEHHDFMNVPGWRLPELRALAAEHYDSLEAHRSWTWVLWHFATSPAMSVGSRIVRTMADYTRGRARPELESFPDWDATTQARLRRRTGRPPRTPRVIRGLGTAGPLPASSTS